MRSLRERRAAPDDVAVQVETLSIARSSQRLRYKVGVVTFELCDFEFVGVLSFVLFVIFFIVVVFTVVIVVLVIIIFVVFETTAFLVLVFVKVFMTFVTVTSCRVAITYK